MANGRSEKGHVFITQGDLTRFACDAWLLPTDRPLTIETYWSEALQSLSLSRHQLLTATPEGWGQDALAFRAPTSDDANVPWLTCIGSTRADFDAFHRGIAAFVGGAAANLMQRPPAYGRSKHLLALPVVGSGAGGGHKVRGDVHRRLYPHLRELAETHKVDLVLVTRGPAAHAAAQHARRLHDRESRGSAWDPIRPHLAEAQRLGQQAATGHLVLFIGAGLSASAGLPTWSALLEKLAVSAGFDTARRKRLQGFDFVDRATLIEAKLGRKELARLISDTMSVPHHGLAHSLLAALPVREIVTTNYDELFELASEGAGRKLTVLPYAPDATAQRWILKLHGSIGRGDIVLTRDDYLGLPGNRAALAGIVQALLITRHMLFVGYSLRDHDFHQIAHDVRKAIRGGRNQGGRTGRGHRAFGTALSPSVDVMSGDLWEGDVKYIGLAHPNRNRGGDGRLVEIMLDAILAEASQQAEFLLDPTYRDLIQPEDVELQESLVRLQSAAQRAAASPVADAVRHFLATMGGSGTPARARRR